MLLRIHHYYRLPPPPLLLLPPTTTTTPVPPGLVAGGRARLPTALVEFLTLKVSLSVLGRTREQKVHVCTVRVHPGFPTRACFCPHLTKQILLPSAVHLEERLTVSQSVRQKHTLWVFCQWQTRVQAVERQAGLRMGSGRMVMQATVGFLVGGLNPGAANMAAAAPPPASTDQDSNRRPEILQPGVLPFDRGWMWQNCVSPLLGAF